MQTALQILYVTCQPGALLFVGVGGDSAGVPVMQTTMALSSIVGGWGGDGIKGCMQSFAFSIYNRATRCDSTLNRKKQCWGL